MFLRIKTLANKIIRHIVLYLQVPNISWVRELKYYGADSYQIRYNKSDQTITFTELNVTLHKKTHSFFLERVNTAFELQKRCNAFFGNENERIFIKINDLKLFITTAQEFSIIYEIFALQCYNYLTRKSSVVIDIGFNVGYASLFFAQNPDIVKIYSYEPFSNTYKNGLLNISANPSISDKIMPFNYGVSDNNQSLLIGYSDTLKGHNTIVDQNSNVKYDLKERIETIDIKDIISDVKRNHPQHDIIAKIDCEGNEYAILEKLHSCEQIKYLKVIMIEWHHKGATPITEILKRNNFEIFSVDSKGHIGLIYAINSN